MNPFQLISMMGDIKGKLTSLGVNPQDLQNVNFSDMNSLNELAQKIMPNLLKQNPQAAQQIKQMANQIVPDKAADIVQIIEGQ